MGIAGKKEPEVAVIIPFYNMSDYINMTLECLKYQSVSYKAYIVNDGSKSDELSKLNAIIKDHKNILVINKENGGLSSARNCGILNSHEDFIIFLDSDDLLGYNQLKNQLDLIKNDQSDVCLTKYSTSNGSLSNLKNQPSYMGEGLSFEYFIEFWERGLSIPIHTALFSRRAISQIFFNERLKSKEDFDFWLQFSKKNPKISFCDSNAAIYRVLPKSMARDKRLSHLNMEKVIRSIIGATNTEVNKKLSVANLRINYGLWKDI